MRKRNIKTFFNAEKELDIDSLVLEGFPIWAFLRNYYAEKYILANDPGSKPSSGLAFKGLKSLTYGWWNLFRKYDYLAVVADNQRKLMDEKWTHPLDLLPADIRKKTLFFEMPVNGGHRSLNDLANRRIVSRFWLIFIEFVLVKFLPRTRFKSLKEPIRRLEKALGVGLDSDYLLRRFSSGRIVMRTVLSIYRPSVVFCTTSYPIMNYVAACKEKSIPVIEIQHGYIGATHRAYNVVRDLSAFPYPDAVFSWGRYEKDFFGDKNNHFIGRDNVYPTGNFYLSYISEKADEIRKKSSHLTNGFERIVSVSMQDPLEEEIMTFLLALAKQVPTMGFILLPRAGKIEYYQNKYELPLNIMLDARINTYEGIVLSDIHTTIWSTTAFEALALGKPNIIMNPNGMAHQVLGHLLGPDTYTTYADTPFAFVEALDSLGDTDEASILLKSEYFFNKGFANQLAENIEAVRLRAQL